MILLGLVVVAAVVVAYFGCVYFSAPSYNTVQSRRLKGLARACLYSLAPALLLAPLCLRSLVQPFHSFWLCLFGWAYVTVVTLFSVGMRQMLTSALRVPDGYYDLDNYSIVGHEVIVYFYELGRLKSPDTFHMMTVPAKRVRYEDLWSGERWTYEVRDGWFRLYIRGEESEESEYGHSVAERPAIM